MAHFLKAGFQTWDGKDFNFVVEEQQGLIFEGYNEYKMPADNKQVKEMFSGVIEATEENGSYEVYIAEEDGVLNGDIKGYEMLLYYVEDGADAKAIFYDLKKAK